MVAKTFEQWWATYKPPSKKTFTVTIAHAAWNAALKTVKKAQK